ncbi:hypothetical protein QTP88_010953 [Uroleucon formosanum]
MHITHNGLGGTIAWPPRSPDLTPLNFYFWGYMKQKVYAVVIESREPLLERIEITAEEIRQNHAEIQRTTQSVLFRTQCCLHCWYTVQPQRVQRGRYSTRETQQNAVIATALHSRSTVSVTSEKNKRLADKSPIQIRNDEHIFICLRSKAQKVSSCISSFGVYHTSDMI